VGECRIICRIADILNFKNIISIDYYFLYVIIKKGKQYMKKTLFYIFIMVILLSTSCLQFRPWINFNNNQPDYSFYVHDYGILEDLLNDPNFNKYIVNDIYVFTALTRYPRPFDEFDKPLPFGKYYSLNIHFAASHLSEIDYTSFIIKDIKIISESGIDYSNKIDTKFPINASFITTKRGSYETGKIFKLKNVKTIVTLTVEINTEYSSEEKILVYNFIPEWNWALIPKFLLYYQ
jgi:hypothetical protein